MIVLRNNEPTKVVNIVVPPASSGKNPVRLDDCFGDYPEYNIEKISEIEYQIALAVPGLTREQIRVEFQNNKLNISGSSALQTNTEMVYQGIPLYAFHRTFHIDDSFTVHDARLKDGLLLIDILRYS